MTIQLIVGLGNPGPEYAKTRHNVGYWFVEKLCEQERKSLQPESKFKGLVANLAIHSHPCRVLQPTTYMNRSGESILALAQFYKIQPKEILVIHDELDLPVGSVRLKLDGGHGGHNGLRDIIARLGTNQFYRLRLGIGHPGNKEDVHDYVLQRPSVADTAKLIETIDRTLIALPDIVAGFNDKVMNYLHTDTK
ncbi:MAG: aminoacyl-tRNA hydrolase [Gammaproteobacteria bacterium]|jgi:PTH1 family peptidyl-tRNA hydrolase|nr:aminoacyl-tRNA hydrolase [Gammaproteobacteria bacterium]